MLNGGLDGEPLARPEWLLCRRSARRLALREEDDGAAAEIDH